LLLVGILSTCTTEDIAVNFQIEGNAELATRQHVDIAELHYDYHVQGFSVELRLKPQARRNNNYSICEVFRLLIWQIFGKAA